MTTQFKCDYPGCTAVSDTLLRMTQVRARTAGATTVNDVVHDLCPHHAEKYAESMRAFFADALAELLETAARPERHSSESGRDEDT